MEVRNVVIGMGAALAVGVLALSVYDPSEGAPPAKPRGIVKSEAPKPEPKEPTREEAVVSLLPRLEGEDLGARLIAVERIGEALGGSEPGEVSSELRERAAAALIDSYAETGDDSPEKLELKRVIVRAVIAKVGGEAAKSFAGETLDHGTDTVKAEAVRAMLAPGAAKSPEANRKALELARAGSIPEELRATVLRRVLGKKGEGEILGLFQQELSAAGLKACAVELQNLGKPALMGVILSRLEEKGLLDSPRMPWISGRLLSDHIRSAKAEELGRALAVAKSRRTLTRATAAALKERLSDPEPSVRTVIAQTIGGAVGAQSLDPESGEELLVARLQEERDPAVKGAIETTLAQVRRARQPQPAPEAAGQSQ